MWGPPPPRLTLRRAVERWGGLDVPYEVATARVLLAQACRKAGDQDGAARSMAIARELFDRIGSVNATGAARSALPGGLSEREAEVLRLVAAGRTNSDIARQFTSVSRAWRASVSNIFIKIGVTSRAAATAYAFEHHLVGSRPDQAAEWVELPTATCARKWVLRPMSARCDPPHTDRHDQRHSPSCHETQGDRAMNAFGFAAVIASGLGAAVLGLGAPANAAPIGPGNAEQTISQLQAQGYNVIVNRLGAASCTRPRSSRSGPARRQPAPTPASPEPTIRQPLLPARPYTSTSGNPPPEEGHPHQGGVPVLCRRSSPRMPVGTDHPDLAASGTTPRSASEGR